MRRSGVGMDNVWAIFLTENLFDGGHLQRMFEEFCVQQFSAQIPQAKEKIRFLSKLKEFKNAPPEERRPIATQIYQHHFADAAEHEIVFPKSLHVNTEAIRALVELESHSGAIPKSLADEKLFYSHEQCILMAFGSTNVLTKFLSSKFYNGMFLFYFIFILFYFIYFLFIYF
jgi:hypothetical protein